MKMNTTNLLSSVWVLLGLSLGFPASAQQFSPGNERGMAGKATMLEPIKQIAPGKALLVLKDINVVYPDGKVPDGIKVHYRAKDTSGKGTAAIAAVATNPTLANQELCWRGVGTDYNTMICGPIVNGRSEVLIDVGEARDRAFALLPILKDGTFVAHAENVRVQLACSQMNGTDTASVFRVDAAGVITLADKTAIAAYGKYYDTFCARGPTAGF